MRVIWLDEDAVLKTVGRDERLGGSSPSRIAKEKKMRKDKRFKTANPIYLYSDMSAQYDLLLILKTAWLIILKTCGKKEFEEPKELKK